MIKNIDHITIVVANVEAAKRFFALLDFIEDHSVVISGNRFATYMQINNLIADHITLVLKNSNPRFEIQLLHFHSPTPQIDIHINRLDKFGYNHMCFGVENMQHTLDKLKLEGIKVLSDILEFNGRKLVYIEGPEGIIVELAQWT